VEGPNLPWRTRETTGFFLEVGGRVFLRGRPGTAQGTRRRVSTKMAGGGGRVLKPRDVQGGGPGGLVKTE